MDEQIIAGPINDQSEAGWRLEVAWPRLFARQPRVRDLRHGLSLNLVHTSLSGFFPVRSMRLRDDSGTEPIVGIHGAAQVAPSRK